MLCRCSIMGCARATARSPRRARARGKPRCSSPADARQRRAETHGADHRHRQERALRQAAMQVLEIHGDQFHGGKFAARGGTVRYGTRRYCARAARALGKNDQRITRRASASRSGSSGSTAGSSRARSMSTAPKRARRDVLAHAVAPVVARGDRPRTSTQPRAAVPTRSPACRCGWCGWRNRCAVRGSGGVPIQRA